MSRTQNSQPRKPARTLAARPEQIQITNRDIPSKNPVQRWDVFLVCCLLSVVIPVSVFFLWPESERTQPLGEAAEKEREPKRDAAEIVITVDPQPNDHIADDEPIVAVPDINKPVAQPVQRWQPPKADQPDPVALLPILDADKSLVNSFLRENLDSGKWEELRWWPPRNIDFNGRVRRICGMKFRTANQLGALVVARMVFDLGNDSVRELKTGTWEHDQSVYDVDGLNWTAWEYLENPNARPDVGDYTGLNAFKGMFEGNLANREAKAFPDQRQKQQQQQPQPPANKKKTGKKKK